MRFIHAADIHLDSPLHGLSAYADAPAGMLRNATREAFSKLVSVAVDERVDFMVIAGDLYAAPGAITTRASFSAARWAVCGAPAFPSTCSSAITTPKAK